jgi:hypothetical protein
MNSADTNSAAADRFQERTLCALWVLFWVLLTAVELQDNWYRSGLRWWEPFLWMGSAVSVGTIWFVLQRRMDRAFQFDPAHPGYWFAAHLKWAPLVAFTMIAGMYGIRHAVYAALGMRYFHPPWTFVAIYESIKLLIFFGLWLGIFFAFNSFRALQGERQRLLLLEKSMTDARLAHLKSQLQPHFFFNVLNTISALMHVDVERADRLVARMGDFLRTSLRSQQEVWPLADEVRMLELYANIMLERFSDRVAISWDIDPSLRSALVPVLIMQPLMENAFRHGVEKTTEFVAIDVSATRGDRELLLEIRNTGALGAVTEGIGVRNVRERLAVMFGTNTHFALEQHAEYVSAVIRTPLQLL